MSAALAQVSAPSVVLPVVLPAENLSPKSAMPLA